MSIIVGIGGASRSGKTTLSSMIKSYYKGKRVRTIHMDEYVFPLDKIPKIRDRTDWEIPESVDFEKLLDAALTGRDDFEMTIVEGILVFSHSPLLRIFDKKIFVEIDYDTFFSRKKADERYPEPDWFIQHIWDSYVKYGRRNITESLVVKGSTPYDMEAISGYLNI